MALKNIYQKLNKTELSVEKIELASAKELASADKKVERDLKKGQKAEQLFVKLSQEKVALARKFSDFANEYSAGIGMSAPLVKIMNDFSNKAKELGVNPESINEFKSAKMTIDAHSEYVKEIQKLSDEAEAIAKRLR